MERQAGHALELVGAVIPTGQLQSSRRHFSDINDVFLDLGGSNWGTVEGGKMLAGGIVGLLIVPWARQYTL